jgi:hypothetical protein
VQEPVEILNVAGKWAGNDYHLTFVGRHSLSLARFLLNHPQAMPFTMSPPHIAAQLET